MPTIEKNETLILHRVFLPVLLGAVIWLFYPGLTVPFLFDDWQVLVHSDWASGKIPWYLGYRPLRNLSYRIDLLFGEMVPVTFHLSNLIYHLLNITLLYHCLKHLIPADTRSGRICLAGTCLVFALHPVQIESVVYISGRRDLLYTLFYLAGLLLFIIETRSGKTRNAWILLFICTVLATSAKEAGITLPVLGVMITPWVKPPAPSPVHPRTSLRLPAKMTMPVFAVIIIGALAVVGYLLAMARPVLQAGLMGGTPLRHIQNVSLLLFKYVQTALWPKELAVDYSFDSLSLITDQTTVFGLLALAAVILFTGSCIAARFRIVSYPFLDHPAWQLMMKGWLWFIITILPMSNIVPHVERFAIHYLYLPLPGIFMIIWGMITWMIHGRKWETVLSMALILAMTCGMAISTRRQLHWWQDERSFWDHTTRVNPRCARALTNFGMVLLRHNDVPEARDILHRALAVQPSIPAYVGLAFIAMEHRDPDTAKQWLARIPSTNHHFERDHLFIKGWIALFENREAEAADTAEKLMTRYPHDDAGFFLSGRIAMAQQQFSVASGRFKHALSLPGGNTVRNHLALVRALMADGQWKAAAACLKEGFDIGVWDKNDPKRLNDMAYALEKAGQTDAAVPIWRQSIQSDPTYVMSALNLSLALYRNGRYQEIIQLLEQVPFSEQTDNTVYSKFLNNVGLAYIQTGRHDKAREKMARALALWPDNHEARANAARLDLM